MDTNTQINTLSRRAYIIQQNQRKTEARKTGKAEATVSSYDFGGGIVKTRHQVMLELAQKLTISERSDYLTQLKEATKIVIPISAISAPTKPAVVAVKGFSNEEIASLVNAEYGNKEFPKSGVRIIDRIIRLPEMTSYIYGLPMKQDSLLLKELVDDFSLTDVPVKVIMFTDNKGKIKKYKNVVVSEKGGKMVRETTELAYVRLKIAFPAPDFNKPNMLVPTYYFTFSRIPYWFEFLNLFYVRLINGKFGDEVETKAAIELFNEMKDYVNTHFYGNGSIKGMLGRIREMARKRAHYDRYRQTNTEKDHDNLLKDMVYYWPCRPYKGIDLVTPDMEAILSQTYELTIEGELTTLPVGRRINNSSNPGPWYSNVKLDPDDPNSPKMKRGDIAFVEPTICTQMMVDMFKALPQKNMPAEEAYDRNAFWKKWESIKLFNLFGKGEIYKNADIDVKTRCIATYNSSIMLPVQLLLQPFTDSLISALDQPVIWHKAGAKHQPLKRGSLILVKQTVYDGVPNRFMELIESAKQWNDGDCWTGIYADNLYVIARSEKRVTWYSLDGEKAESAVKPRDVGDTLNAIVLISRANRTSISTAYIEYFTNIFPTVAAAGIALIGNQQIIFPAMGSGVQGTFFFNCGKMTSLVTKMMAKTAHSAILADETFTPTALQAMLDVGYNLTIESVEHFHIEESIDVKYYRMDLLGYDFVPLMIERGSLRWVAILRFTSLLGALLFRKDNYDEKGNSVKVSKSVELYFLLIRMRTVIVLGGWYYPSMYQECIRLAVKYQRALRSHVLPDIELDAAELMQHVFGDEELYINEFDSMISLIFKPAIPTFFDIVWLLTGNKQDAILACKSRFGTIPNLYLAPIDILDQELNVEISEINEEIELPQGKLIKLYPKMNQGAKLFVAGITKQGVPVGSEKFKIATEARKGEASRKVATKDVGRPLTEAPVPTYVKRNEESAKVFYRWVEEMREKGDTYYRVPIPLFYLGKEDEIVNERAVGRASVVDAIVNATGYPPEAIEPVVRSLKKVKWIVKPIAAAPGLSEFETDPRPLEPHRVINRKFTNV